MSEKGKDIWCGVIEWGKKNTLNYFGHIKKKRDDRLVKKIYGSEEEGNRGRGIQPAFWEGKER